MPLDIMYEKVSAFQLFCCLSHHNNQKASNDFHRWLLAPHFLTYLFLCSLLPKEIMKFRKAMILLLLASLSIIRAANNNNDDNDGNAAQADDDDSNNAQDDKTSSSSSQKSNENIKYWTDYAILPRRCIV
jgi:hypothetical protein